MSTFLNLVVEGCVVHIELLVSLKEVSIRSGCASIVACNICREGYIIILRVESLAVHACPFVPPLPRRMVVSEKTAAHCG